MYSALFSTAYFGLFRVSEVTSGEHPIKAKDVRIAKNKKKMMFILRTSKTHGQDKKLQIIKINSKDFDDHKNRTAIQIRNQLEKICPYELLVRYIEIRHDRREESEPFFIFRDAIPVTPANMRSTLRLTLEEIGLNPQL